METETLDDFLAHYGVKGMRWGVRKARGSTKGKTAKGTVITKPGDSEDFKTAASLRGKSSRELSNSELKALTSRMQLEKQYAELTRPKKPLIQEIAEKQGRQFLEQMIKQHGATLITGAMGYASGKSAGGASGFKEPASSPSRPRPPAPSRNTPGTPTPVYNITTLPRR